MTNGKFRIKDDEQSIMMLPTFIEENILWNKGYKHIAGIDEVGRGCFAGPVVAAAVILSPDFSVVSEIRDSKKLSPQKREKLAFIIKKEAVAFAIAEVSVHIINVKGIAKATQIAFHQAIQQLTQSPDFILIDAFYITTYNKSIQKPIIRGDEISISIAAASIIAKVYRDDVMRKLHEQYAQYDFYTNKGYGTKKHQEAIKTHGLSEIHRTSFNLQKFL